MIRHYRDFIYGGLLLWGIGLFAFGTKSILHALLLPLASLTFYLGVFLWLISERKNEDDPNTVGGVIHMTIDQFSFMFGITKYLFVATFLYLVPFSSAKIIPVIKEKNEWNKIISLLDKNSELDTTFGHYRVYTYPEWKINGDSVRFSKIHTKGTLAIGSFSFIPQSSKIDSINIEE